jgi:hypothetical protein
MFLAMLYFWLVMDSSSRRFPFISCEIFTCEIDVILKTLVEDEKLMDLLFGFLEPNRPHSALLAGYFGKVSFLLIRSIYKGQQILGSARCVLT